MPTGITSVIQLFVYCEDFPGLAHISSHSDSGLALLPDVANILLFFIAISALLQTCEEECDHTNKHYDAKARSFDILAMTRYR